MYIKQKVAVQSLQNGQKKGNKFFENNDVTDRTIEALQSSKIF